MGSLAVFSVLATGVAHAQTALTASCTGTPGATSIVWAGTGAGGVTPYTYAWGNGSTSSSQTVSATPGTYSMTFQVTDASSTIATTTCGATVALPAPTISSFTASPTSVLAGGNSTLSWSTTNAASLSISGIGAVTGTSKVVSPAATTVYTLTAVNATGTTTAAVTVTVGTTTSPVAVQLKALLDQIAALKAQIATLLLSSAGGSGSGTATTTPGNPRFCLVGDRDLRRGDRGDDVRELQRMLAADPSIYPEALVSGVFGEKTEKALKKFQKKFGTSTTTQNGAFDRLTRDLFHKHCGKGLVQVGTGTTTLGVPAGIFKKSSDDHDDDSRGRGRGRDD